MFFRKSLVQFFSRSLGAWSTCKPDLEVQKVFLAGACERAVREQHFHYKKNKLHNFHSNCQPNLDYIINIKIQSITIFSTNWEERFSDFVGQCRCHFQLYWACMDKTSNKQAEIKKDLKKGFTRGGVRRWVSIKMSKLKDSRKEWQNRML